MFKIRQISALIASFICWKVEKKSTFITSLQKIRTGKKLNLNLALRGRRYYSTVSPKGVKYDNADTDKLRILSENRGKIGVYMWINLETGKRYIGSSVDLKRRFLEYFNAILKYSSMTINRALLKYGYSGFQLEIIEYCTLDELAEREKHYFIKPGV